jgi:Bacterial regulatory proteins, luxR family
LGQKRHKTERRSKLPNTSGAFVDDTGHERLCCETEAAWVGRVGPIVPTKPEKQSSGLPSSRRASARFSTRSWHHPNKVIAYDLGISVRAVEVHRARMMERLRVRQLAEAIRLSVMAGMPK